MVKPLNEITQQVQASLKSQAIRAGQNNGDVSGSDSRNAVTPEHIDAINKMVALFKVNYGNQFNAAYPDLESVNTLKKLWLTALTEFTPAHILKAAEILMKKSQYLPNLSQLVDQCEQSYELYGLPDPHSAYVEACMAPSPKAEYEWRHPAVYFAARATGWHFLGTESESTVFPVFERNYQMLCRKVMQGESLEIDLPQAIPASIPQPLSKKEQLNHLAELRSGLKLAKD